MRYFILSKENASWSRDGWCSDYFGGDALITSEGIRSLPRVESLSNIIKREFYKTDK